MQLYEIWGESAAAREDDSGRPVGCGYGLQCRTDGTVCGLNEIKECPYHNSKSAAAPSSWHVIETQYKGYHFRSRLEARWAVYFDALDIKWEYEKEGYDLGSAGWYLPDFWLPEASTWAEVKSTDFTHDETDKVVRLGDLTRHDVLMLVGVPDFTSYWYYDPKYGKFFDLAVCWHKNEAGRFYRNFGAGELVDLRDYGFDDEVASGIMAARSARFEHGACGGQ